MGDRLEKPSAVAFYLIIFPFLFNSVISILPSTFDRVAANTHPSLSLFEEFHPSVIVPNLLWSVFHRC